MIRLVVVFGHDVTNPSIQNGYPGVDAREAGPGAPLAETGHAHQMPAAIHAFADERTSAVALHIKMIRTKMD